MALACLRFWAFKVLAIDKTVLRSTMAVAQATFAVLRRLATWRLT